MKARPVLFVDGRSCWKPSLHMPRLASRILLEITAVRVERLCSMSQQDARAEGVIAASGPMEAGLAFRGLWLSIYGSESPWVWVIEFKRVEAQGWR
ncbi:Morphogenetic protein [Serratia silvae]